MLRLNFQAKVVIVLSSTKALAFFDFQGIRWWQERLSRVAH